jgi:hypothetical protein
VRDHCVKAALGQSRVRLGLSILILAQLCLCTFALSAYTLLPTPMSSPTSPQVSALMDPPVYFSVGPGYSDVIPHQIVRANTDHVYVFAGQAYSADISSYWTTAEGLPNGTNDFAIAAHVTGNSDPISLDAVYDGGSVVHVLVNMRDGQLKDYPFNITSNAFNSPITLATDSGTLASDYLGTSGVSGMVDLGGRLHVAYWTQGKHITHRAYTYDSTSNALTPEGGATQVDASGSANHPVVAVSPLDNSLTVAWISEATDPARILARSRTDAGVDRPQCRDQH